MSGYRGPSIDHTILSPSGKVSKSARNAAIKREAERLFSGVDWCQDTPQPTEAERLVAHAARLRELAARGMSPRKFMREAARSEAQAAEIAARGSHE